MASVPSPGIGSEMVGMHCFSTQSKVVESEFKVRPCGIDTYRCTICLFRYFFFFVSELDGYLVWVLGVSWPCLPDSFTHSYSSRSPLRQ